MMFEITNVLGETRPVTQLYSWNEDSKDYAAYNCPFCCSAVSTQRNVVACENPWCLANPMMPVAEAQKLRDKASTREREEIERKRNHELAMIRIREDNERRIHGYQEFAIRVRAVNGCLRCSNQYHDKIRKHRAECPKAA